MSSSWGAGAWAALAVAVMGFAIQRGGTCTVAAVDEVLSQRRAHRLAAMLEASLWVIGALALAQMAHIAGSMPAAHAVTACTVAGGVLLGLGAWVNGACVFGAIARLGSGQWAQALTPVGFFFGCWTVTTALQPASAAALSVPMPAWSAAAWLGPLFVLYALWRIGAGLRAAARSGRSARRLAASAWSPHAATIVIGVSFAATLLLAGPWAYTDVLADLGQGLARGMAPSDWRALVLPLLLFAALYLGAGFGGWSAGRWQHTVPKPADLLRAFFGGALMGWGSLLIPGSNDGLILIGMPLFSPHAWLAFASMALAIAAALLLQRAWVARAR
jgi:Sulphur transport